MNIYNLLLFDCEIDTKVKEIKMLHFIVILIK